MKLGEYVGVAAARDYFKNKSPIDWHEQMETRFTLLTERVDELERLISGGVLPTIGKAIVGSAIVGSAKVG